MTAEARLLALRLQGFKSFAERTTVEFGSGISAVVGPNGSGKSNLADALRWTLGEQGRALRIRRSEDVIFAGSERRAALGMADVSLILDNSDGLFPVDYRALELGRRLYRSGENDYLLNRQRVRLKDLAELLDTANLADNAFLFIGQGMVDQALALRPEERRPLFEEVAGVRRHERRRQRAEEQLAESEANLARVEDIVAELRPQARRLAAQAEQQTTRRTVGDDLAAALLLGAHARWHTAAARLAEAEAQQRIATGRVEAALGELSSVEARTVALAGELRQRADVERERRVAHEAARSSLMELQLRETRATGELQAILRDRDRIASERSSLDADLALQRRAATEPVPAIDIALEGALAEADRALGEAMAELAAARAAQRAETDRTAAMRRAAAARQTELETARRRLEDARRRAREAREAAKAVRSELDARETAARGARATLDAASAETIAARETDEAARTGLDRADADRRTAARAVDEATASVAAERSRLAVVEALLDDDEARGVARAARSRGGRRLDEELISDPAFRGALESALGPAVRGFVVDRAQVRELTGERALVLVAEAVTMDAAPEEPGLAELRAAVQQRGGGALLDAVRRDPSGATRHLLGRVFWVPDLDVALDLQSMVPPGAALVVRDGSAVVGQAVVTLGRAGSMLERRAEVESLRAGLAAREDEQAAATRVLDQAERQHQAALGERDSARERLARAEAAQRQAEEGERAATRSVEAALREATWADAQAARLGTDVERLEEAARELEADMAGASPIDVERTVTGQADTQGDLTAWDERTEQIRARRERIAAEVAEQARVRRQAEARRSHAEASIALAERRLAEIATMAGQLSEREQLLQTELRTVSSELAAAAAREAALRAELEAVAAADLGTRESLAAAEAEASAARERLREGEEHRRSAEVAELEARLGLDAIREGLLVELAGLGDLGLQHLEAAGGGDPAAQSGPAGASTSGAPHGADELAASPDEDADGSVDVVALERSLDAVAPHWAASPPPAEPPSPSRLGLLRRRYHELGASNPFAVEEYGALRTRLETLETQERDLRDAITRTRALIAELQDLVATQFRATFRALEGAFERRFRQLFDGGHARLMLTDPENLAATGIEIIAQPPGKKAQPLAMLSGGERALTAVALLFAMLEVRPVPFCVLDEVDAALDEANVGRFVDALRELAEATQFVVITHNRGTIEAADALYGVTVGDDSVSRVISLRLEEARELAGIERPETVVDVLGG